MKIRFFAHLCVAAFLSIAFATTASAQSEADLAVIKTGPDLAAPGSNVSYDVTISNGGPNDAAFVTLTDTVPAGMTYVSATQNSGPTFTCDSSVSCTITTFPAGATANFTFVFAIPADAKPGTNFLNVATASSETPDPNSENDTGIAGTNTPPPPTADIALAKSGPAAAGPDTDVTFTLTLTNAGPDAATNVVLTDNVPAPMTFVSFIQNSGPAFSCGTSTCTAASFPAGATAVFQLTGHVPNGTTAGTTITNFASVTSDSDPNGENDAATATVTIQTADASIIKSGPANATAGTNVTYTIAVTNAGPDTATDLSFSDSLPAGTTFVSLDFVSGTASADSCATPPVGQNGTVACTWAVFGNGATAQYALVVAVGNTTSITNTVTLASASSFDPNANNNSSSVTTNVTPSADLSVTKSGPATAAAGSQVSYTLTVVNNGPSSAANFALTDAVPAGTTFVSFQQTSGPGLSCAGTATVTCTTASLAPAATATFTFVVAVSPSATGSVSNTASVTSSTSDPNAGNNSSTVNTSITQSADLAIAKNGPASVTPTGTATWTITLGNNGPSDASNVSLADTVPAGTTFVSWNQTSGPAFACSAPPAITCTAASFGAGATATFELVATIDLATTGAISNTATASSSTSDPNPSNNTSTSTATVGVAPADVGITKTADTAQISVGGTFVYTLVVTNQGPGSASNIVVTDPLPGNTQLVGAPTTTQGTCSGTTTVTCNVGTLAAGGTATIQITLRALSLGTIANTASVTSAEADPNSANGSATASVTAVGAPAAIPTLGPWALALLAFALATVMFLRTR